MKDRYEDYPSKRIVCFLREASELQANSLDYLMHEIGAGNVLELWRMMADAIEDSYLPIPLREDGYPVKVGETTRDGKVEGFEVYEDGNWLIRFEGGSRLNFIKGTHSQRVPLPHEPARCPDCGELLSETGVIKLIGYMHYPNEAGEISRTDSGTPKLDDTEGYRCAHCGKDLDYSISGDSVSIEPFSK